MSNFNMAPFLPQRQPPSYPPQPKEQNGFPQPIPSIVVNPHEPVPDYSMYYPSQHPLPAPDQRKAGQNVILYPPNLPAQRLQSFPNGQYGMTYPIQNAAPIYYYPNQMYPQYREDNRYFRPMFERGYSPIAVGKPEQMPIQPMVHAPIQTMGPLPPMGIPVHNAQGPTKDHKVNFKPMHTKKNSRPKINKIPSDPYSSKIGLKRKLHEVVLGEYSLDTLYASFQEVLNIDTSRANIAEAHLYVLQDPLEQRLFDLYVNNLSLGMDVWLPQERFQKIVAELALYDDTRMILNSIFCLSSLILLRMEQGAIDPSFPLKYYQRSVKSIRYHLSLPEVENHENGMLARCLLSTILLCIYELFFVAVDSTYVKGAGSILISILSKRDKSETGLLKHPFYETCFWGTFVCDLVLSLKFDLTSTYSLERVWRPLDPEFFDEFDEYPSYQEDGAAKSDMDVASSPLMAKQTTFWWQNKVMMLFSSINEFSNMSHVLTREDFENNKQFYQWQQLNRKVEEFERNLPSSLKPIVHKPATADRVFPLIYFKDEQTAIVGLNFKLAKISLHDTLCLKLKTHNRSLVEEEMAKYPDDYRVKLSMDVVGIMQTYDSNLHVWPVNIHSLRLAGKFIARDTVAHDEWKKLTDKVFRVCHTRLDFIIAQDE